jgi:tRNA pseudouridine65 synthase
MSELIVEGGFKKEYLAVVRGYADENGEIDYALKEILDKMTDKKARTDKEPQEAITFYETLTQVELPFAVGRYATTRYSLLRLKPTTGRKHQLRRHMKHILHPIVGDTKYGRNEHNVFFREHFDCHRLLLHASKLSFVHPLTKEEIVLEAGLDEVFENVVKAFEYTR